MRYSDLAIEQNKKWLVETAVKNSTPNRLAEHMFEAAEQIAQLQADLREKKEHTVIGQNIAKIE